IRTRAGRLSLGMIPPPPPVAADEEDVAPSVAPPVPVRDGKARQSSVGLAAHPIGRLVARVVLRAGAAVEEAVVESDVFDLSTGTRCSSPPSPLSPGERGDDVASLFEDRELVPRAEWELRSTHGRRAQLAAQRPLAGTAAWVVACPHCGRAPTELVVCKHEGGHCACDACSLRCPVCAEDFCADHGIANCRVDNQPACEEHA